MASGPQSKGSGASFVPDFDFQKFFTELKLPPTPDLEAFAATTRRNMETLSAANRVAVEGAQAVARRHMEIVQQNVAELTEAIQSLSAAEPPQAKAAKQAELVKRGYERAVGQMKELGDLIRQSNTEALELLNKRFAEAMDEVKGLAEKSK